MSSVTLPEKCDRSAAEAVLPELVAAMGSDPIAIDGAAVKKIGMAMLQVLVSARRSGGGAVIEPSPALRDAAQIAGLNDELFEEAGQ